MAMGWYVLQALTSREKKVGKYLQLLADGELKGIINDVKIPAEDVMEVRNGKRRTVSKIFLPGYVLVEIDMPETGWEKVSSLIRQVDGVMGFVGYSSDAKPQPITKEEARGILQRSGDIRTEKRYQVRHDFAEGEEVRIINGPFDGFTGTIEEINYEKGKMKVMVGIFGRGTPVELDFDDVEKI